MATRQVYRIQPETWKVEWEVSAPGVPFGMTWVGNELRVLCGETSEDHRIIRRLVPRKGFDPEFRIPCPEDTGSQLSFDGHTLYVSQWYLQRVLALSEQGWVQRILEVPHQICGQTFANGALYLLTTDDESTTEYFVTRMEFGASGMKVEDVAKVPFQGRSLAFDGLHFWSNHREKHETVCFKLP